MQEKAHPDDTRNQPNETQHMTQRPLCMAPPAPIQFERLGLASSEVQISKHMLNRGGFCQVTRREVEGYKEPNLENERGREKGCEEGGEECGYGEG